MKLVSENIVNLDSLKNLPLGSYLVLFIDKLLKLWHKTTYVWLFIGLFFILIGSLISAYSINIVLNNLG